MTVEIAAWRSPLKWRIAGLAFSLFFVMGALLPYSDASYRTTLSLGLGLLGLATVVVASVVRPEVTRSSEELHLRSLLRTRVLRLSTIKSVEPYRNGLDVVLVSGKHVLGPGLIGNAMSGTQNATRVGEM